MFLPGDIYTSSGSLKLYHCWTDKVTKFDSSSFYNWEQDNMPVYDLDERTFYLWEQLGYPTSAIGGVALVVSADASNEDVACNKNIFRSVSAAIEALPQTINFPIIIEIANFGDLGELRLNNYKFGPRGSLEIINRNFALQELSFSNSINPYAGQVSAGLYPGTNTYKIVSGTQVTLGAALPIYENTAPIKAFNQASCLSISSTVFSSTFDARLSGSVSESNLNAYLSFLKSSTNSNKPTLVVASKNTRNCYIGNDYTLGFMPYAFNADSEDDISSKDASTTDWIGSTNAWNTNDTSLNVYNAINGLYYGNRLYKVVINNCDGPIYIRNIFLDGFGSSRQDNHYGIEVNNSPNVFIENSVVCRYRKAGYYINNSTVNFLRSCVANRNYDFDSDNVRISGRTLDKLAGIYNKDGSGYYTVDSAAGLLANNSVINFSSTTEWELAQYQAILGVALSATPIAYRMIEFNENSNGVILNNSVLAGGEYYAQAPYNSGLIKEYSQSIFDFNYNTNYGLVANNSKIDLNGKIRLLENLKGASINQSQFMLDEIYCKHNQYAALELNNSNLIYNKNLIKQHDAGGLIATTEPPYYFSKNGVNLKINASKVNPVYTSSMEERYGKFYFENPIGYEVGTHLFPSIIVENNSEATLLSTEIVRTDTYSNDDFSKAGSEIECKDNSRVTLRGTRYFINKIIGPDTRAKNRRLAALAAINNSTIEINGPTVVAQFGINLLADKNSTININPAKKISDQTLDYTTINLSEPKNHTMVELHSTRSCIVVDNQSTLNMEDLGSYSTNWDMTNIDPLIPDYIVNEPVYVSAGSMQFYPNPIFEATTNQAWDVNTIGTVFTKYNHAYGFLQDLNTADPFEFSSVTWGGVCVRALNNSVVNVNNVNFPCGWWNCSAPYYDGSLALESGGACYKTFIWNIADNSILKASYLSVSSLYPSTAGYNGPGGYWQGSTGQAFSGVPITTPDTSSTSILDIYGANPSGHPFTTLTTKNYGPFRLYFSVDPVVNSFSYANAVNTGFGTIPQIYSQGYQPSTSLICSGDASSLYTVALQTNSNNQIQPSGFYYGKDMLDSNGSIRVFLDESAANTFANAKHCSAGKSNNAKLVSIYYPYIGSNNGDSAALKGVASVNLFDLEKDN